MLEKPQDNCSDVLTIKVLEPSPEIFFQDISGELKKIS